MEGVLFLEVQGKYGAFLLVVLTQRALKYVGFRVEGYLGGLKLGCKLQAGSSDPEPNTHIPQCRLDP